MVRFRKQASTRPIVEDPLMITGMNGVSLSDDLSDEENQDGKERQRQKRRSTKKKGKAINADGIVKEEKKKEKPKYDDELDPYDSDPGESYRSHCMKINGVNASCLRMPRLLKQNKMEKDEHTTTSSTPPSPLSSETDETLLNTPETLPSNTTRVRYSLRSSIGDGSQLQPTGPSLMSRRELRPNNVHVNVSHWSDCGQRPYMEDRYELFLQPLVWDVSIIIIVLTPRYVFNHQLLCGRSRFRPS